MLELRRLETCLKEKRFVDGLQDVNSEISHIKEVNKFSYLKEWLSSISSTEEFDTLIRLTDEGLMHQYSAFLIRYSYKKFPNMRTLSLYCDELIDDRKILDAEKLLKDALEDIKVDQIDSDILSKAYFTLVRCLLEMKRNEEAFEYMKKAESYSTRPVFDKWGYFYIQTGEWEKAENSLLAGMEHKENEELAIYLLSQLYAYKGEQKRALQLINDAIDQFPQIPYFYFEKVKHLLDLQRYEEMLIVIDKINRILPYHSYKAYFTHLRAEALYKMNKIQDLLALLKTEVCLKKSLYHNMEKYRAGKKVRLPLVPIVQKDNYCVPASLEMMLRLWGERCTQDEIANHIFDVTGSKFSDTVTYLEKMGYVCRYFKGNEKNYKALLDRNIPVLLSIDIEHASHVQVLSGYDDQLQAFFAQDPNFLEPLFIEYEKLQERYRYTDGLSIVFVPKEEKEQLSFLVEEEDVYFRKLFSLTDHLEEQDKQGIEKLVSFLQETSENPYTWLYTIKHMDVEVNQEFILFCAERLIEKYPDSDFVKLHSAQCFIRIQDMERASDVLQSVEKKNNQALYHFIHGRYSLEKEEYEEAISSFRSSLQLDADQPIAWSFLALSYMYIDQSEQGLKMSQIALGRHPDRFVLVNHGLILMDLERYKEAYEVFNDLLKEYKREAHIWYERAKCAHQMEKLHLAIKGLRTAIQLDKTVSYPYVKLSEIYELDLDDKKGAEEILLQGIENCEEATSLYVRLGDLHFQNDEFEEAEKIYKRALEENNRDVYSHFGLIQIYMAKGQYGDAKRYIFSMEQQFEQNDEFLMNAGMVLWDAEIELGANEEQLKIALSKLEKGIRCLKNNIANMLEEYVNRVEGTVFIQRGIAFLRKLGKERPDITEYDCYAGILYESLGQYDQAMKRYHQAIKFRKSTLPYYRIGESLMALGELESAKNAYETCLEMDSTFIGVHVKLAEIYEKEENRLKEQYHMFQAMLQEPMIVNMEYLAELSVKNCLHKELLSELDKLDGKVDEMWRLDALAYVYGAMKEREKEQELVEEALQIDEEHVEVRYHYAKVLVKKRDSEAIPFVTSLIRQDIENERVFEVYVQAMEQQRKVSQIRDSLHLLPVKKKERSTAFMYAASVLAERLTAQQQNEEPKKSIFTRAFYRMKNRAKEISFITTVIDLFEISLKLNARNSIAAQRLAMFYENGNMIKEAIDVLQTSLENIWDVSTVRQLVNLLIEHGDEDEEMLRDALEFIKQMIREEPNDYNTLLLHSNVLFMLGEEKQAEKICLQLIERMPFVSRTFLALAEIYQSEARFEDSISMLEEGVLHHPKDRAMFLALAASYHQIGKTEKAEELTNYILSFDSSDLLVRYNRACYLAVLNRNDEAKAELETVLHEDETGFFAELVEDDEDLVEVWETIK
ncbi:bacteriocin-processing peptidase family protein [Bacillus sp. TL12]|uniref:bacteriocin-processing peptidase family protein n=1 Tax=Bacillus sp. TL12 TaxID=2894756 RepID=UPI001F525C1C|nr:bacteriocin-processing peptidase family protein [Bacillus sp. TL12]MCI0764407.1 tetratricopeptide repeat protein [Bacillus sp. TL12]